MFISIGQVAKQINTQTHTIRFWLKEFSHIKYNIKNGRKYFDHQAIEELQKIQLLSKKMKLNAIKNTIKYGKIREINEQIMINNQNISEISITKCINIIEEIKKIINY